MINKEYKSLLQNKYPNFIKLTEYLNSKQYPYKTLQNIITICKPRLNGISNGNKKAQI